MRLIDADELYDKAEARYKNAPTPYRKIYCGFVDDVADAPTVDAVPVIRCKDCVHFRLYGKEPFMYYACDREGAIRMVEEDDFCKHGKRVLQ